MCQRPCPSGRACLNAAHAPAPAHLAGHPPHLRRHAAARRRGAVDRRARARVPGRAQRLGQVDLAQDRGRDSWRPTAARASRSPARRSATCRRSRTLRALPPRSAYVEAGLAPGDDAAPRALSARTARPDRRRRPARLSGGEARRAALARVLAPAAGHPAARRADQPSRPAGDRMAGGRARRLALRAGADQPRPALPRKSCRARPCGSTAA